MPGSATLPQHVCCADVLYGHVGDADSLSAQQGSICLVLPQDEQGDDRAWCTCVHGGVTGRLPRSYLRLRSADRGAFATRALFAFEAEESGELSILAGETVRLEPSPSDPQGWVTATVAGRGTGLVPVAFVQPIDERDEEEREGQRRAAAEAVAAAEAAAAEVAAAVVSPPAPHTPLSPRSPRSPRSPVPREERARSPARPPAPGSPGSFSLPLIGVAALLGGEAASSPSLGAGNRREGERAVAHAELQSRLVGSPIRPEHVKANKLALGWFRQASALRKAAEAVGAGGSPPPAEFGAEDAMGQIFHLGLLIAKAKHAADKEVWYGRIRYLKQCLQLWAEWEDARPERELTAALALQAAARGNAERRRYAHAVLDATRRRGAAEAAAIALQCARRRRCKQCRSCRPRSSRRS